MKKKKKDKGSYFRSHGSWVQLEYIEVSDPGSVSRVSPKKFGVPGHGLGSQVPIFKTHLEVPGPTFPVCPVRN